MKALLLDSEHGMQLVSDYLKPVPAPSEALIRVTRAGICNTDLEILKGYAGFHGEFMAPHRRIPVYHL